MTAGVLLCCCCCCSCTGISTSNNNNNKTSNHITLIPAAIDFNGLPSNGSTMNTTATKTTTNATRTTTNATSTTINATNIITSNITIITASTVCNNHTYSALNNTLPQRRIQRGQQGQRGRRNALAYKQPTIYDINNPYISNAITVTHTPANDDWRRSSSSNSTSTTTSTSATTTRATTTKTIALLGAGGSNNNNSIGKSGSLTISTTITTIATITTSTTTSTATNYNNQSSYDSDELPQIPEYIRTTAMGFCITIMVLGVIGNVMVPIVIVKTKDMRNSTNIFLTNLSIADLLVLLVCTPTVLVEVNTRPETWILGHEMCKAVPFVELTVAHASVLTILAISFERYYAICEPLKAGYVCTKARAILICTLAWGIAALFTSPIILIANYQIELYYDGSEVAVCYTAADTFWKALYFVSSVLIFFFGPFAVLLLLYAAIAYKLLQRKSVFHRPTSPSPAQAVATVTAPVVAAATAAAAAATTATALPRPPVLARHQQSNGMQQHRKQVIFMLLAVVASFFLCHLPFRALTLWIIIAGTPENMAQLGVDGYYGLLYFSRVMFYLNSALNPILYNLMSTKFRTGFWRLASCCCAARRRRECGLEQRRGGVYYAAADRQRMSVNQTALQLQADGSVSTSLSDRRRHFKRNGTFVINSMSTSSGSGATERTSWRSGSSLSHNTSSGNAAPSAATRTSACKLAEAEKHTLQAAIDTTTCIYESPSSAGGVQ